MKYSDLPSGKVTWQLKIIVFNRRYIFKGSNFHCYVSLPECTSFARGHITIPRHMVNYRKLHETPKWGATWEPVKPMFAVTHTILPYKNQGILDWEWYCWWFRNPAPVDRSISPLLTRFFTYQLVQDLFHQQYGSSMGGWDPPTIESLISLKSNNTEIYDCLCRNFLGGGNF